MNKNIITQHENKTAAWGKSLLVSSSLFAVNIYLKFENFEER